MGSERSPERVETRRLVLRRPRADDAGAIFARYAGDPEVTRYLAWPRHASVADTRAFLAWSDAEWQRWPAGPYLVEAREGGALLGSTGLAFETARRASTGYVLARNAWGRGFASEAVGAVVELARAVGVLRLHALVHVAHRPSQRVLEKCGFEREGVLRRHTEFPNLGAGGPEDVASYARVLGAER